MVKAIIFDFDDTLVTTLPTKVLALQDVAMNIYGFKLKESTIKKHWGKPYRMLMEILFAKTGDTLENVIKNYEHIRNNYRACFHKDVIETLDYIEKKTLIGILTASPRNLILQDLHMLQFPYEKFFYIQSAEDTSVHKPHPDVFIPLLKKLERIGITISETIYVGDSLHDFAAAKGAGLQFYAIAGRTTARGEFIRKHASLLTTLNDLRDIVD